MAEWIKWEKGTAIKPEIYIIAKELNLDPLIVPALCLSVWEWADSNTTDGNVFGVTISLLDRIAGVTGFGAAMEKARWIVQDDDGIFFPNFDRHNGKSAKERAKTQQRVQIHRAKKV